MSNRCRNAAACETSGDGDIGRGDGKVLWSEKGSVKNAAEQKAEDAGMQVVQNHCSMVEHRKLLG